MDGETSEPSTNGGPEPPTQASGRPPASSPATADEWASRYKYLLADFENYRRRTERERDGLARQTRAQILRELIPIYEAFQEARKGTVGAAPAMAQGFDLLAQEWQRFLQREGVAPVAVLGEPFAPEEQEAIAECAADAEHADGSVAEIVQQGYRFSGGLLRPAKIVVARSSGELPDATPSVPGASPPKESSP